MIAESLELEEVCEAVQNALHTTVSTCERMREDAINCVYRLTAGGRPVVMKVFKSRDWPETGKLKWIDQQLARHDIARPQILYHSSSDSFDGRPFVILEWIEGTNVETLIREGHLSRQQFVERLGELLAQVHCVKIARYGTINEGNGRHSSFVSRFDLQHGIDTIRKVNGADRSLYDEVKSRLLAAFTPLEKRCNPVLTHGDPSPKNCLLTRDDRLVLLDWDNASSSLWSRDYAHVTYSCAKAMQFVAEPALEETRNCFFKGYGMTNFTSAEVAQVENAWHALWAYNALAGETETDSPAYVSTRNYLLSLL